MKVWQCTVCRYIHREATPPEKCPVCGVDKSRFIEIDEELIPARPVRKPGSKPAEPGAASSALSPFVKTAAPEPLKKQPLPPEKGFDKIKSLALKHHAHPISVHTPNGILPAAVILWILSWIFNSELLAKAAMINMVFVVLALPVVIFTGVLEWKKKYQGALTLIFKIKILAVALTTGSSVISLLWYVFDPKILTGPRAFAFILVNIIMAAAAGTAGHIGGKLVFKD
ncbi:MAG: rubredoxin [Desulfobacula sp. GWF2_41_7]|nr:MAG: rubredoxin [Desulfobacula sp. GWF2_41_7]